MFQQYEKCHCDMTRLDEFRSCKNIVTVLHNDMKHIKIVL